MEENQVMPESIAYTKPLHCLFVCLFTTHISSVLNMINAQLTHRYNVQIFIAHMLNINLRLIVFFALFMSVPDHLSSVCFCFMCFCWRLNKWCCGGASGKSGRSFTVPLHPKIALKCDLSDCESTIIVAVASEAGALLKSLPTEPSTQYVGVDIKHHHPASSSRCREGKQAIDEQPERRHKSHLIEQYS